MERLISWLPLTFYLLLLSMVLLRNRHAAKPRMQRAWRRRRPRAPLVSRARGKRKPLWVADAIAAIVNEYPNISCRQLSIVFNRRHSHCDAHVGKSHAAKFLKEYRHAQAHPRRHSHDIDNACALRLTWVLDLTEWRPYPDRPQPIFGLIDHGSRQLLRLQALRSKGSIEILRLLLDAIDHYGKPKAIRTDNDAIFTSWTFAFALHWLDIRHQRTKPHCPWMNGRIERVWRTVKDALRMCRIPDEAELQTTLEMLRQTYNQHRPHQALSGFTPDEAAEILERRRSSKRRRRR